MMHTWVGCITDGSLLDNTSRLIKPNGCNLLFADFDYYLVPIDYIVDWLHFYELGWEDLNRYSDFFI